MSDFGTGAILNNQADVEKDLWKLLFYFGQKCIYSFTKCIAHFPVINNIQSSFQKDKNNKQLQSI